MQRIQGAKERQDGLYNIGRNKWEVFFGYWQDGDSETGYNLRKKYTYKPANREIVSDIFEALNRMCGEKIQSGYIYKGMPVWLSAENQKNYETARNIARDTNGASLPETVKFGGDFDSVLYAFDTVAELDAFYRGCHQHIRDCLEECWRYKQEALERFPVE